MNPDSQHVILVLSRDAEEYRSLLAAMKDQCAALHFAQSPDDIDSATEQANVVLGEPDLVRNALPRMNNLQWIQSSWAGVTPLLPAAERGIVVTGVKGVFGAQMAEFVLGFMLDHALDIPGRRTAQAARRWDNRPTGRLEGKILGVMGTGSIGAAIAQQAQAFGMRLLGFSRSGHSVAPFERTFSAERLKPFLASLDYVVCVLPATPDTDGLLDSHALRQLPEHALLINVGRGNVIVEQDLVGVLNSGHLAGAVLDVFQREPLPQDHPFWETPRLTMTAHVSARSWPEDIAGLFLENYRLYQGGKSLNFQVDPRRGY